MNESSQILSEINIFGVSRKENHEFLSTTTFPLGPIGEEVLIEVGNVNSSNYTTDTHLTKNYNLSIVLDNPSTTNGNIQILSVGSTILFLILLIILPIALPSIFVSILCPKLRKKNKCENCYEKFKSYNWLPAAVFATSCLAVLIYTPMAFNFVDHGFESGECRQNFKCFDEKVYLFRSIALPVNKIWSSFYFISIGIGIILATNWNCHFCAFGGLMVSCAFEKCSRRTSVIQKQEFKNLFPNYFQILQGLASIIYHQCPNNTTKGIDVIPMQATALLAIHYILIKIFVKKVCESDTSVIECDASVTKCDISVTKCDTNGIENDTNITECDTTVAECDTTVAECDITVAECDITVAECDTTVAECDTNLPECDTTATLLPQSPGQTESSLIQNDHRALTWCKKNIGTIENIQFKISMATYVFQLSMIVLTIGLQLLYVTVVIPVVIIFCLYIFTCVGTSYLMYKKTNQLYSSIVGLVLSITATVTFVGGGICFFIESTKTGGEPWESREKNKDCWIGMFDQHDLWHFLVATSLAFQIYRLWSCCGQLCDDNRNDLQNNELSQMEKDKHDPEVI